MRSRIRAVSATWGEGVNVAADIDYRYSSTSPPVAISLKLTPLRHADTLISVARPIFNIERATDIRTNHDVARVFCTSWPISHGACNSELASEEHSLNVTRWDPDLWAIQRFPTCWTELTFHFDTPITADQFVAARKVIPQIHGTCICKGWNLLKDQSSFSIKVYEEHQLTNIEAQAYAFGLKTTAERKTEIVYVPVDRSGRCIMTIDDDGETVREMIEAGVPILESEEEARY